MKKTFIVIACLATMMAAGTGLKAQEVTITLMPGWTWISIPSAETMDFATALGSFTPAVGDRIKSQWGNATYRGNGEWRGQISEFYPGYGYMYYSARMVPVSVTFNAQQPTQQVVVTTDTPQFITGNSAMGGGNVTSNDGTYILVKGICWATHETPTSNDSYLEEGSGEGSFSASMTGLNWSTTYYVRAYAVTPSGTVYGEQQSFTTRDGIPTLTTDSITSITAISATSGGNITDDGGLSVTARGVCWSTSPNPTLSDSHTSNGTGTGSFTSSITDLEVSTTYYVRAYATTNAGTAYGEQQSFTTRDGIPTLTTDSITSINAISATCGGNITDDGGLSVTARGVCWSTSPNPTVSDSHTSNGTGTGSFTSSITNLEVSTTYYVRAYATTNAGTAYGNEESFTTEAPPTGAIAGLFSVSESQQVYFSQGNLQYIGSAATPYWKFADLQWDYFGTSTGQNSSSQNVDRDLFGWGTSGYNHGAVCYQPWSTSETSSDYYAYGSSTYNLYDQTGQADWGYNPISNGGNQPNQWRTLTIQEWRYVMNTRTTTSGIRYAKATVFGINGVILLPDDWSPTIYSLSNTNSSGASFNSNVISAGQWITLEIAGAVFLPAAGHRAGTSVREVGVAGEYWSANTTQDVYVRNDYFDIDSDWNSYRGSSVRLVRNAE